MKYFSLLPAIIAYIALTVNAIIQERRHKFYDSFLTAFWMVATLFIVISLIIGLPAYFLTK